MTSMAASVGNALSEMFNLAGKAAVIAGGFVIGGYFGSLLFDPFFFPVIHDPLNQTSQALIGFLKDNFGFMHEWMGLTGEGGLLQTEFAKSLLGPYMPTGLEVALPAAAPAAAGAAGAAGGAVAAPMSAEDMLFGN